MLLGTCLKAWYLHIKIAVRGLFESKAFYLTITVGGTFEIKVLTHYNCCWGPFEIKVGPTYTLQLLLGAL